MPILTLNPNGVVSQSGFTGATLANLQTANTVYATSATGAGHTILVSLDDAPGDYDSLNSLTLSVQGRASAAASRAKSLLVELLDSVGGVISSFQTASLSTTNTLYTSGTFTPALAAGDVTGLQLRITVQEAGGMADTVSTWVDYLSVEIDYAAGAAPINTVAPTISGGTAQGSLLTTTNGTWTGAPVPTFTYEWLRNGTPIGGATASTYTTVVADLGTTITSRVTGTNTGGSSSAVSSNSIVVTLPNIAGDLVTQETGSDTAVASGTVAIAGTSAAQETGADILAASGTVEAAGVPARVTLDGSYYINRTDWAPTATTLTLEIRCSWTVAATAMQLMSSNSSSFYRNSTNRISVYTEDLTPTVFQESGADTYGTSGLVTLRYEIDPAGGLTGGNALRVLVDGTPVIENVTTGTTINTSVLSFFHNGAGLNTFQGEVEFLTLWINGSEVLDIRGDATVWNAVTGATGTVTDVPGTGGPITPTAVVSGTTGSPTITPGVSYQGMIGTTYQWPTGGGTISFSTGGVVYPLIIAGGASGGNGNAYERGGGGGSGGMVGGYPAHPNYNFNATASSYAIAVGLGGVASTSVVSEGVNGGNSSITGVNAPPVAIGGGGGSQQNVGDAYGSSGGSGGGNDFGGVGNNPGTANQGNRGSETAETWNFAGGGGGAGAPGQDPTVNGQTCAGGDGLQSDITGSLVYYAGGGGGTLSNEDFGPTFGAPGGLGGGGDGRALTYAGRSGVDGLGGGGAPGQAVATDSHRTGKGGDGTVILFVPDLPAPASNNPSTILGANVVEYWDIDDTASLFQINDGTVAVADTDPVGYWAGQLSNRNLLSAGTERPVFDATAQAHISFDGSDDFLDSPVAFAATSFYLASWIYVATAAPDGRRVFMCPNDYAGNSTAGSLDTFLQGANLTIAAHAFAGSVNAALPRDTWVPIEIYYDATDLIVHLNGVQYTASYSDVTPSFSRFAIAANRQAVTSVDNAQMRVARVAIAQNILPDAGQRASLLDWLENGDTPAGGGITGTLAAQETGSDGAAITGEVPVSGSITAQETGTDGATMSGAVDVTGALVAQETGNDTAAINGGAGLTGSLAVQEAGADVAALVGTVAISGSASAQEAGADTASMAGAVLVAGSLATQETGTDAATMAGTVSIAGALLVQEAGADLAIINGGAGLTGSLSAQETGTDLATVTGVVPVSGSLASQEAGSDLASAAGAVTVAGTMSTQESGSDVAFINGGAGILSSMAVQETGTDTATAAGQVAVAGALAAQEIGADLAAASGQVASSAGMAAQETGTDTATMTGTVAINGSITAQETGADLALFNGGAGLLGALIVREAGPDTFTATGDLALTGAMTAQEAGADLASAAGQVALSGALVGLETGQDAAAMAGSVFFPSRNGALAAQEGNADTATAAGTVAVTGSMQAQEGSPDVLVIVGGVAVFATFAATETGEDQAAFTGIAPPLGSSEGRLATVATSVNTGQLRTAANEGQLAPSLNTGRVKATSNSGRLT